MAKVEEVAKGFLSKNSMSPKKLQKLVYYFKAWGLVLYKKDMIEDTDFEAWVHGPVSPKLYRKYKNYGWNDIEKYEGELTLNEKEKHLLESVWITYGDLSANELEALTHSENPWRKARLGYKDDELCDVIISEDDMKDYYSSIYIGD